MSVKDILMSLVDDGMVDTDKIGTSVYFWAFPGKARQKVSSIVMRHNAIRKKLISLMRCDN